MIQIAPQMKVLLMVPHTDFRKGIDGLAGVCKERLREDPFSGALFLFRNRSGTTVKGILYDGQGFWLVMKRLSQGRFKYWPTSQETCHPLLARELAVLLWNGDPRKALMGSDFRKLT